MNKGGDKIHFPRNKEKKNFRENPRPKVDVNEETSRLFKKNSDIRDNIEYRHQERQQAEKN